MLQTLSSNVAGWFLVFVSVLFTNSYKKIPVGKMHTGMIRILRMKRA